MWLHESDSVSDRGCVLKWRQRKTLRSAKLLCAPLVTMESRVGMFDPTTTATFVNRLYLSGLVAAWVDRGVPCCWPHEVIQKAVMCVECFSSIRMRVAAYCRQK
jgi:hypothetical protein